MTNTKENYSWNIGSESLPQEKTFCLSSNTWLAFFCFYLVGAQIRQCVRVVGLILLTPCLVTCLETLPFRCTWTQRAWRCSLGWWLPVLVTHSKHRRILNQLVKSVLLQIVRAVNYHCGHLENLCKTSEVKYIISFSIATMGTRTLSYFPGLKRNELQLTLR